MKIWFLFAFLIFTLDLGAQGISFNAGLTPAQDRIILRSQYRYMSMDNDMMKSSTQMIPLVAAYGLTPAVSIMGRGRYVQKSFSADQDKLHGFDDLFFMSKFRLYRKNTAKYTIGIAPYIGSNIPMGNELLSNRTWNPVAGLSISFRPRFFSLDFSISYVFRNILEKEVSVNGDVLNMNAAFSAIIPLQNEANDAISPVIEINYQTEGIGRENSKTREKLFLSPGASFVHSSLVLEALAQLPIYQSQTMNNDTQKARFILGVKYMF